MPTLETIQIETQKDPDSVVIWLHGLGANGNDFVPIIPELNLPDKLAIRFIFPHAPIRPITINQGAEMPGWYDISNNDVVSTEDKEGILETAESIFQLCQQQEMLGIAADRIILAGFSQGGAIALHCGIRYPKPLAGIMALSTYLPLKSSLKQDAHDANKKTDIFMAHGSQDNVVATQFGKQSYQILNEAGYPIHWHEYAMPHSVCPQEIADIGVWIENRLS